MSQIGNERQPGVADRHIIGNHHRPVDNFLIDLNIFLVTNSVRISLFVLFFIFTFAQVSHYHQWASIRKELADFLVENEIVTPSQDIKTQVDQFTSQYDCYSLVDCIENVAGTAALANRHSEHAPHHEPHVMSDSGTTVDPYHSWYLAFLPTVPHTGRTLEPSATLVEAFLKHKQLLILDQWLRSISIPEHFHKRLKHHFHIDSLTKLAQVVIDQRQTETFQLLSPSDQEYFQLLFQHLSIRDSEFIDLDALIRSIRVDQWKVCLENDHKNFWTLGSIVFKVFISLGVIELIKMISNFHLAYKERKCGFLTFITGSYLAPQNCKVIFDWQSPTTVSSNITFSIKFYQRNFKPYPITTEDQLSVHITNGSQLVPCSIEFGDLDPNLANVARVSFSPKKSGNYTISILIGNTFTHIRGSPFKDIRFQPLSPSPYETLFVNHCSTVVCVQQKFHALTMEMRDRFGNQCILTEDDSGNINASSDFSVNITEIVSEKKIDSCYYFKKQFGDTSRLSLLIALESSGVYHALVSYKGSLLKNGEFNIVCLKHCENEIVKLCTSKNTTNLSFEAKLLPSNSFGYNNDTSTYKTKNVYCCLSSKQLKIKEYILKIIPKQIATFRILPSTKFYFVRNYNLPKNLNEITVLPNDTSLRQSLNLTPNPDQFMIIDDGSQAPIELISPERNIIVALFTHSLLNKIGGSETFQDKQNFFYSEVRRHHIKHNHLPSRIHLKVNRESLLKSSFKITKSFSKADWCKNFVIEFADENGIDWGGLRREWYELLFRELFDPDVGIDCDTPLFTRFSNDKQGLIHPNPHCKQKLQYYEFAGKLVGKILLDSSMGSSNKCLVNARFTRSFLAQWNGFHVNYRYFEQDDSDLYVSKIKFILENDVSSLDLYFTEEEYDRKTGKLIRTFDLIPNGSNIRVTENNKIRYLDALAQYRLSNSVKDQVEAFLKGLNDLIPDNLLSIFDENEIELLVCGAATYSLSDLRLNHVVTGSIYDFQKVVDWFWRSLSNFTDQEFARLLQFTTGCSHLPPGGFAELNPRFQITSTLTYGNLPTAHTCFNQICLPDYDSFEDFDRALRIAITEGSEGFGLV